MQSIVAESKIHFYQFMQIQLLHEYIQTGIQYMVKSIINSNDKLIRFRYFSHEIASLISAIKDIFFLIRYKGIYAENFYGLQRPNQRNKKTIALEILVWVVLPYIWQKIDKKYNQLKQQQQANQPLNKLAKIFLKIYPICYCLIKIISTVLKFRYLIHECSKYYNIKYSVTKTQLSYIDVQQPSQFPIMSFLKSPGLFFLLVAHKIASVVFSGDKKKKVKEEVKEVQAPIVEKKSKQCPICGKNFKNPAVLRSSGYVFCYNCITQQVKKERKCPVTSIPSEQTQIQIIYQ